jgi:hypothetical protein
MTHWMFRCQEVSRKVSHAMDAPLPLHQRIAIRIHLMMCRYCARFRRQLVALRKMSRLEDPDRPTDETPATLSEDAKRRIKEKLRSRRASNGG